jgi:kynurenine formamidase
MQIIMAMSSRANYTMNEVLLLTSLVDARRHVLENKATQNDLELQDAQKSGWVVLCAEYNAHEECTTNRTVKQLSEKWDTLKTKAKGAQTAAHKELSKTGPRQ